MSAPGASHGRYPRLDQEVSFTGFEYWPFLSNNIIATFGISALLAGAGFRELYDKFTKDVDPLLAGFLELNFTF